MWNRWVVSWEWTVKHTDDWMNGEGRNARGDWDDEWLRWAGWWTKWNRQLIPATRRCISEKSDLWFLMKHLTNDRETVCRATKLMTAVGLVDWLGGLVVSALDSRLDGLEFDSWPPRLMQWMTIFGWQTTSVCHPATQSNSAFYPQRDGKWVQTKVVVVVVVVEMSII